MATGGASEGPAADGPATARPVKLCPECGEFVPSVARKCRHCQFIFDRRRRITPSTFVGAVLLLVIGAAASLLIPKAWEAATQSPSVTEVLLMRPWKFGTLDPQIEVTGRHDSSCSASIISSDPESLRCFTQGGQSLVLDPCWPEFGEVVQAICLEDPWSGEGILVTPTVEEDDTGDERTVDLTPPTPWALELANGERCVLSGGATGSVAGMRLNYGCGGEESWVVGEVDQRQKLWTVLYSPDGSNEISQVAVTRAWL